MKRFEISVFVGSSEEGLAIAKSIREMLNNQRIDEAVVRAKIWDDGTVFGLGNTALEALQQAIDRFAFAVMVFTPDDLGLVRRKVEKLPRDNVLFELGLFMARLGVGRSLVVKCGEAKIPSDLEGLTVGCVELPRNGRSFDSLPAEEAGEAVKRVVEQIVAAIRRGLSDGPLETTVHYVAPSTGHSDYYNNFLIMLQAELAEIGSSPRVTWRFHPRRGATPYGTLKRVLEQSRPEDVVILVPKAAFEKKNEEKLLHVINAHSGRALILFDQPAPQKILDGSTVSFVGPNNALVGIEAANIMRNMLSERDLKRAKFIAIQGPGGITRATGFRNAVKDFFGKKVEMHEFVDDDRTMNVRSAAKIVRGMPKKMPVCLFAGNDESALALLEIDEIESRNVYIVGCDAIPAMRHRLTSKRPQIATIDTNLAEQARRIRNIIQERRWGEHDPVPPTAVLK